jgi:hypothetical protein
VFSVDFVKSFYYMALIANLTRAVTGLFLSREDCIHLTIRYYARRRASAASGANWRCGRLSLLRPFQGEYERDGMPQRAMLSSRTPSGALRTIGAA